MIPHVEESICLLSPLECQAMAQALNYDHEAFLMPGERFIIQEEAGSTFTYVRLELTSASRHSLLVMEGGIQDEDMKGDVSSVLHGREALFHIMNFLRHELYLFFREDRNLRVPIEWSIFEYDGALVRFKGAHTRPSLEGVADALLDGTVGAQKL